MSDGGAAPKVSRKVLSRRDNHEGIITREGRQMGAAAKYELRNPATSRAAELEIMSGTLGPDVVVISHLNSTTLSVGGGSEQAACRAMNIDDVLFGLIVCGIGLAGACFRSEYVLLRELRATERRKERVMRQLHSKRLSSQA